MRPHFGGKNTAKIVLKYQQHQRSFEFKTFTVNKLTSPGESLEVQDEGKFFAEPYDKEESTNSQCQWKENFYYFFQIESVGLCFHSSVPTESGKTISVTFWSQHNNRERMHTCV